MYSHILHNFDSTNVSWSTLTSIPVLPHPGVHVAVTELPFLDTSRLRKFLFEREDVLGCNCDKFRGGSDGICTYECGATSLSTLRFSPKPSRFQGKVSQAASLLLGW